MAITRKNPDVTSSTQLLARVLDAPDLVAQVQRLPPKALGALVERIGLEDAGEVIALATTEQLARVFDDDLWASERPGEDEAFDDARFLVWLRVMREAGDAFLAHRLSELPEDLITLAFHKHVLVLDLDAFLTEMNEGGEDTSRVEKALEDRLCEEIDGYQLVSRHDDGWDDVLAAILALDRDHPAFARRLLDRCVAMSAEHIEDNGGLYEVLTSDEMLEDDVAGAREERRAAEGHVAPSAAAAFLKLARTDDGDTARDALTRAYFRRLDMARALPAAPGSAPADDRLPRLLAAVDAAEVVRDAPRLAASAGAEPPRETLLAEAMRRLERDAPDVFAARNEELAYLANVLAAGCSFRGRRLRPIEAVRAALATCNLALSRLPRAAAPGALRSTPADALFRRAWAHLHRDVIAEAARVAEGRLRAAAATPRDAEDDVLRAAAERVRAALVDGAPWKARDALDLLPPSEEIDRLACLLDELPSLGPAPDEVRFLETTADVALARATLTRASEPDATPLPRDARTKRAPPPSPSRRRERRA